MRLLRRETTENLGFIALAQVLRYMSVEIFPINGVSISCHELPVKAGASNRCL